MSLRAFPGPFPPRCPSGRGQRGAALIISLLMMLMITLLGIAMLRSLAVEARIAGNTGEKQHAFQAAQSALQYGEWWLTQGNASAGFACTGTLSATTVCTTAVAQGTLTAMPWSIGSTYTPTNVNGAAPMPVSTSGGAGTYFALPQLYIYYLGFAPDGETRLYQVTAAGNGGNANAVAVVQSTFAVSPDTGCKKTGRFAGCGGTYQ